MFLDFTSFASVLFFNRYPTATTLEFSSLVFITRFPFRPPSHAVRALLPPTFPSPIIFKRKRADHPTFLISLRCGCASWVFEPNGAEMWSCCFFRFPLLNASQVQAASTQVSQRIRAEHTVSFLTSVHMCNVPIVVQDNASSLQAASSVQSVELRPLILHAELHVEISSSKEALGSHPLASLITEPTPTVCS